eukprot:236641-Pleurochrysis_carterae.AAC.1
MARGARSAPQLNPHSPRPDWMQLHLELDKAAQSHRQDAGLTKQEHIGRACEIHALLTECARRHIASRPRRFRIENNE